MHEDYSSPDFMGNAYTPNNGTLSGSNIGVGNPQASKRTMVGDGAAPRQDEKKRITTLAGFLVSFSNSDSGDFWPLREGNNSIGTEKGNEILLHEKHVSGNHATINISHDGKSNSWKFQIVDKSSSNGTFVNGERLTIYQGFVLKNRDLLKIGEFELMLFTTDRFENNLVRNPNFLDGRSSADYSESNWQAGQNNNTRPGY
jgi:hypothetical protein